MVQAAMMIICMLMLGIEFLESDQEREAHPATGSR